LNAGLYTAELSKKTYSRLAYLAGQVLAAGYPVVVDAAHLKHSQRETLRLAIEDQGAPCLIVQCTAALETLAERINSRQLEGTDPSDADISIARHQLEQMETLTGDEQDCSMAIDTGATDSLTLLVSRLRARF
jgi:predicted kinase